MITLHPRMFISQRTLEAWIETGNVAVGEDVVHLRNLRRSYRLEPAVRFVSSVPEDIAPDLMGKVLTEDRIETLGGEIMGDSVVFGEAAFVVEPGFIGALDDAPYAEDA